MRGRTERQGRCGGKRAGGLTGARRAEPVATGPVQFARILHADIAKWSPGWEPPARGSTESGAAIQSQNDAAGTWRVLAITLAVQAMVAMAVLTVPSMAPAMARALAVSPSLVGVYIAAVYVGALLSSMAAGPLVTRLGAVRVSQLGLLGCAAGMALQAAWPAVPVALAGAFITGLGYGPITPASSHLLVRTAPPHRVALIFSLKQTGVPLGGVLAGALVPSMAVAAGASAALWAVGIACAACTLLAQPIRRSLDADRTPGRPIGLAGLWQPLKMVAGHPRLRRLAAVSFVFSAMQMCLATYLVTYLNADLGFTLVAAGVALSVSQVGGVAGRILWGWMADRWVPPVRMLAALAILMALCSLGTGVLPAGAAPFLLLPLVALFGASATGWNGVYLAEVAREAPAGSAGAATGGSLAFTFLGVVVGPMAFGLAAGLGEGYRLGYLLMALPVAACAWVLLGRRRG